MRHVAAGRPHRLGKNDMRGQFGLAASEELSGTASMRGIDAASEQPTRLQHLVPRIMHCSGRVVTRAHERKFVGQFSVSRENFRNLNIRALGLDGLKRPANLPRRIRFHVPSIQLARRA